ncbi:MAG: glucose PTS transporter subunit IIA [Erysipelotrichaceae bacterium]|nr:glucose PTS transporter subunit IIA [Erysipelotrichaceae bacterium]MDY5252796.1 glucose PTS transporter subunit IIA [Erysipelotrichaceae bacterium]
MAKYTKLVQDIIVNVGGKENVKDLRHCVTRLRFNLLDESKANDEVLKNMDGVISVVKAAGQYMVVIGEHVTEVYDEACKQLGLDGGASVEKPQSKKSPIDYFLGVIMAGMGPTLNLLCACGIIKGLMVIAAMAGLSPDSGLYALLNAAGDCIFYSLPLVLGFNVAKKFEIDPYFGLLFGAALTYPTIQGVDLDLFGFVVNAKYTSTFLPVLFGLMVAIPFYKLLDRHIHPLLKGFLTPMITLLIMFPITFVVIGPVANLVGVGINFALNFIFEISPVLGGLVMGGLWQILVMFGVHGIPTMFAFYDLLAGNPSTMLAMTSCACFAVCGTLLAVFYRTKQVKLKSQSFSAFISAFLGVTEPAMYGIIIPRKMLLIITCIGGAAGGLVNGLMGLKMYTYAGMGIIGTLSLLNPEAPAFLPIVVAVVVPFVVTFVITMSMYKGEEGENNSKDKENKRITIAAPADGKVESLKNSTDEVFANEVLGKGCLIQPDDGSIYSPITGTITTLFPTKHAVGITGDNGVEILIHIGINTVNLKGEYFESFVKQNEHVEEGQLLIKFDKEAVEKQGFSCEIPVIITNSSNYLDVVELDNDHHKHGEDILTIL